VVLAVALVIGVPLFLRMPPWCDLTLYDVAARNLLTGGLHYRDVFDTNLPGFPWALTAVRAILGWSVEALRAVDLLIVTGAALLLNQLTARAGADRATRMWMLAAIALFYPFQSEFNHGQRDVWMMLPALAAVVLRVRTQDYGLRTKLLQGVLWGVAVWIKPHVIVPAALVWLLTAPWSFAAGRWRGVLADLLGNLLGGLAVGAAGVGYLLASGTWPYFVDVFTFWNTGYAAQMWDELPARYEMQLRYFPPWSYLFLVGVPTAVLGILDARPWSPRVEGPGPIARLLPRWLWDRGTDETRFARLALAAVYLGWVAQALYFQRAFHYVHIPEVILGLAVLAMQRWAAGFALIAWLTISSCVVRLGVAPAENPPPVEVVLEEGWPIIIQHPLADPARMRLWPECWRINLTDRDYYRRMTALGTIHHFHAANDWEQLDEVADWLTAHGVRDGDVLCWHDAPHALYLLLRVRPAFRFQHVGQMMGIGLEQDARVRAELCDAVHDGHIRYVVSDLLRVVADGPEWVGDTTATGPDLLPPSLRPEARADFPYDQPAVFRSGGGHGRYIIHELRYPIRGCGDE
jgi:hypothetical protein